VLAAREMAGWVAGGGCTTAVVRLERGRRREPVVERVYAEWARERQGASGGRSELQRAAAEAGRRRALGGLVLAGESTAWASGKEERAELLLSAGVARVEGTAAGERRLADGLVRYCVATGWDLWALTKNGICSGCSSRKRIGTRKWRKKCSDSDEIHGIRS
jgi:hypothetical protein